MTEEDRIKIDKYGARIDCLAISRERDKLKFLLDEMEQFKNCNEEAKNDAGFNYYLGTGLGLYSDLLVQSGKQHTDLEVIELRRTSMFYLRKGLAFYNPTVHTDPRSQLRILTNYANGLDTAGRVFEALRTQLSHKQMTPTLNHCNEKQGEKRSIDNQAGTQFAESNVPKSGRKRV